MKILFLVAYIQLAVAETPCTSITGPQITGADLASANPAFAGIPSESPLAPAPLPGSTRIFYPAELQSIASRFSFAVGTPDQVCFRFATGLLNREQLLDEMRKALNLTGARIELLETSPGLVPDGKLDFPLQGLGAPAAPNQKTPLFWRGTIIYAGDRRFPVQAKVRIAAPFNRVVAMEALKSGMPVRSEQLRLETVEGYPPTKSSELTLEQVASMVPLRPIAAGGEVRLDNLTVPNDVNRGDLIHVEVRFGAAHLALTGRAETGGRVGEIIAIRNLESKQLFRARIEARDRAIVTPGEGARN